MGMVEEQSNAVQFVLSLEIMLIICGVLGEVVVARQV